MTNEPVSWTDRFEISRLINTWLRETCPGFQPPLSARTSGQAWRIPIGKSLLLANCRRFSPSGFHVWDTPSWLHPDDGRDQRISPGELASAMADSLQNRHEDAAAIKARMLQSIDAVRRHATHQSRTESPQNGAQLEQALWFGHPFHPLAKSVAGFSAEDFSSYSPERTARFRLHWLLADPDIVTTFARDDAAMAQAEANLKKASGLAPEIIGQRVLLPCHPWQAERLKEHDAIRHLTATGKLALLGPSGEAALPTSSVRTVRFEGEKLHVKLPLEARITNFSRVNTREQLARSIAGSRAMAALNDEVSAAGIHVYDEPVGRILLGADGATLPETGFLLRTGTAKTGSEPLVVAGLLDPDPQSGLPCLARFTGLNAGDIQGACAWAASYAGNILLPLLHLFAETGISLEAHAQNSLITIEHGLPARLHVRDLEGIAVDRDKLREIRPLLAEELDQSIFYRRETVWQRLLYYVVVNHFSHVLAALSDSAGVLEAILWGAARRRLEQVSGRPSPVVRALLGATHLPAKANFLSCLAGRGEQPAYVMIPNPLAMESSPRDRRSQSMESEAAL